jgi:hypothetical protein
VEGTQGYLRRVTKTLSHYETGVSRSYALRFIVITDERRDTGKIGRSRLVRNPMLSRFPFVMRHAGVGLAARDPQVDQHLTSELVMYCDLRLPASVVPSLKWKVGALFFSN